MPPLLAPPGMPTVLGEAAESLFMLELTPAKEWYWCSPRCLWRSNWSCIWSCWSCWEELDEELEDAERLTPDNCDSSSAMGSPEETSDSRTVAWTGWWWTLAVRLALALPKKIIKRRVILSFRSLFDIVLGLLRVFRFSQARFFSLFWTWTSFFNKKRNVDKTTSFFISLVSISCADSEVVHFTHQCLLPRLESKQEVWDTKV